MAKKKPVAHIVSHTHWDREWRYPIWQTRLMLVEFMDELIDVLEKGIYPGFLLDGQLVPVLDYLEIRPEMKGRLQKLIAENKLQVGPWLLLPDEYPIDGESMVRNLLWGRRQCEAFGGVFNVGYTPFGWGQTAQLPQLYAGFGIDVAMIGKRVSKERAPQSEFVWRGPDGTELLTTRFGGLGRQNFYFIVHLSALVGYDHEGPLWDYHWDQGGVAFHRCEKEFMEQDHFMLNPPERCHLDYITKAVADQAWETTQESVLENDRLMMNGCDYTAAQKMSVDMIARLNEVDPDREWVQTTMPEFVKLFREKIDRSRLTVVEGELRDGPAAGVTGNALTTRLYLKQLNKKAQNELIRYAEPLSVLMSMQGVEYPLMLINKTWEFLMNSHPHDSINGVTQDKTVRDVQGRLDQVIDLSQSLGERALQELIRKIDLSRYAEDDILVVVVNPLPYARREVVEAFINLQRPAMDEYVAYTPQPSGLEVFDGQGHPIDMQWECFQKDLYSVAELHTRAFPYLCHRHRMFFDTGEIPAGGYKTFKIRKLDKAHPESKRWTTSEAKSDTLRKDPQTLENEFLRVRMNGDGTLDLTDKTSGKTFPTLNYFEDRCEFGDYWINRPQMYPQTHTSLGCQARIWTEEAGPLQATLVSEVTMRIPKYGIRERQQRSEHLEDLVIRSRFTLRAGERQVHVKINFVNNHEDHYLRVMLPTGMAQATHADASGHFYVDRRPIKPQGPSESGIWPDMATLPFNHFVDVSDGKTGLAIVSDSLTEYEVVDHQERTLALSLLRSCRNWICTETRVGSNFPSQKGGQALGEHEIRFSILPHDGDWQTGKIRLAADRFNMPCKLIQTRKSAGTLPTQASLFEIDNDALAFSSLKKAEDRNSYVLRLYNPTAKTQKGNVRFFSAPAKAWLTNLNEERISELKVNEGQIRVEAPPCKILTLEIACS